MLTCTKYLQKITNMQTLEKNVNFDNMSHHQINTHLKNILLQPAVKQEVFIYNAISLHPQFVQSIQKQNNI